MNVIIVDIWLRVFEHLTINEIIKFKLLSKDNIELINLNWKRITQTYTKDTFLTTCPYDYQIYMSQVSSSIWNVDMGLGKTLSALMWLKKDTNNLIICPKNIINVWTSEIKKHCPKLSFFVYHYEYNSLSDVDKKFLLRYNLIITTYSQFTHPNTNLLEWNKVVYDECHRITNNSNKSFNNILKIKANQFLAMSGTPIKNGLHEMINLKKCMGVDGKITIVTIKKDQVISLPKLNVIEVFTGLDKYQKEYDTLMKEYTNSLVKKDNALALREIIKLRQLCAFSKISSIVEIVESHDEKIVIMSKFTYLLKTLKTHLKDTLLICGEIKYKERQNILTLFKTKDRYKVLLMNIDIGSEGIDLTCSNILILTEPWWNEECHKQSISRIYRYGQTKECIVYKLLVKDSIETTIDTLCLKKRKQIKEYLLI